MKIAPATSAFWDDWAKMRAALWPDLSCEAHRAEIERLYSSVTAQCMAFLAVSDTGRAVGFSEASLRRDFVNGCDTSPVLFLEGIFVDTAFRGKGVGKSLCEAAANWGRAAGCSEFASDAYLEDLVSHAFHKAVGFEETERVVYFRKLL
jgi:aminoglycoside 6'-N-acetyltransferase I